MEAVPSGQTNAGHLEGRGGHQRQRCELGSYKSMKEFNVRITRHNIKFCL